MNNDRIKEKDMFKKPEPIALKMMTVEELSALIHRAVPSIKSDLTRKPESLPPRIKMPGSKRLLWLEQDVIDWLQMCRQVTQQRTRR